MLQSMSPAGEAAQPELQRALSVAMPIGVALSVVYLTCTVRQREAEP